MHRDVLTTNSEYFRSCLKPPFTESVGVVTFDDIDPKYLALFIGLAYYHSTVVPATVPRPANAPQASAVHSSIREYVEVHKLCDRFICPKMAVSIEKCIETALLDGHRAMYRDGKTEENLQKEMIRNFADGYESMLDMTELIKLRLCATLLRLFTGAVQYAVWEKSVDDIADRPRFIMDVSKQFAAKLLELETMRKFRRRELKEEAARSG